MNAAARKALDRPSLADTLVYGIGGTGLSAARYLVERGIRATYFDTRREPPGLDALKAIDPDAAVVLGQLDGKRLAGVETVIVSPGIADRDPVLARLRRAGKRIVSDVELFVADARADFVAVTGSNGKSTVTTLIAEMCAAAGRRTLAGGNLGRAALDLLAEPTPDLYVLELSSFQLQRTPQLPARVAVLLNVSPDHLDWHRDLAEYRAAKHRVFAECTAAVYNRAEPPPEDCLPEGVPALTFGLDEPPGSHFGISRDDGRAWLAHGNARLLPVDALKLVGRHNWANALAALAACEQVGIDLADGLPVLEAFTGLPHRMQFVRTVGRVRYVNDSKATNVGAAAASVRSIDAPVVLIAGGQGKGGDFDGLATAIAPRLRALVVYGEDAEPIATAFRNRVKLCRADDLEGALFAARRAAQSGDTVLLAPACASFDQFENYERRGDAFAEIVTGMGS